MEIEKSSPGRHREDVIIIDIAHRQLDASARAAKLPLQSRQVQYSSPPFFFIIDYIRLLLFPLILLSNIAPRPTRKLALSGHWYKTPRCAFRSPPPSFFFPDILHTSRGRDGWAWCYSSICAVKPFSALIKQHTTVISLWHKTKRVDIESWQEV